MLSAATTVELNFPEEDNWVAPKLYRAASVNSWGVTQTGGGWTAPKAEASPVVDDENGYRASFLPQPRPVLNKIARPFTTANTATRNSLLMSPVQPTPIARSPPISRCESPRPTTPRAASPASTQWPPPASRSTPSSPRPRRRSSQQRVSLVAGRVLIAPVEVPVVSAPIMHRAVSSASSIELLPMDMERESFLGGRNISEFVIEGEIGRGAYGLVKRAREIGANGELGPPLVIKQIIKSRILADCWKKHPKHGTIPIEIYVLSAISSSSMVLPAPRPWDPARTTSSTDPKHSWVEGVMVSGHPNISPLLDYFEDNNYYYLVSPSTTPEVGANEPRPPSDLFDLVETYPQGLPSELIRTYLGQIADAMDFLHGRGIVHRDIKDENVVLGPDGKCILIDFGSSGLVKRTGWDTFSGTLDYAGPEILRGERYHGKEQDVWAFGVVAYVLLVGECPFHTPSEAQDGLQSPFASAAIALDERCIEGEDTGKEEPDGGGALVDAAALVRACLHVDLTKRPTFEQILKTKFLAGRNT